MAERRKKAGTRKYRPGTLIGGLLLLVGCGAAHAEDDWQRLGLFRIRDLTPFGLTRLDFLPAHSMTEPPGTFAVEFGVSYQNTWARSDNVAEYLQARGGGRRPITETDINAIRALPGDAYLVDGEYGLVDMTLHYKASSHFGGYLTIPYFFFNGGGLDAAIEGFHDSLGFGDAGRKSVPRNQWLMIAKFPNTTISQLSVPENDFGDPVLGVRYSLFETPEKWNLIFESALKIPRSDEEFLISTGEADYGVQASYQRFFDRNALYATLAVVYYNAPNADIARDEWIPTLILGWETRVTEHTGFVLQFYGSRSTVQQTNLRELSANKYQATAGLQWNYRGNVLRFGLTENIGSFNNTPDVGLTLSFGRIFTGHGEWHSED